MLNWLKQQINPSISPGPDQNATLRVIGDRRSGKTTYMASLAYWPNASPDSVVQTVSPIGEGGNELIAKAQNILEQGLELEGTDLENASEDLKDYTISITLKQKISKENIKLNINCKDYPGEFFTDLIHKQNDLQLLNYLEDCVQGTGILFLLDGTTHRKDSEYAQGMEKFLMALDRVDLEGSKRRLALVLGKCEQPELWVNRHQPKQLAQMRFPKIKRVLDNWVDIDGGDVDYFTTSAFGMLGNQYPEPNARKLERNRDGTCSVLKDPQRWRPFGLVAPVYWLCCGHRHKQLEQG
jgi:hypothetical protein